MHMSTVNSIDLLCPLAWHTKTCFLEGIGALKFWTTGKKPTQVSCNLCQTTLSVQSLHHGVFLPGSHIEANPRKPDCPLSWSGQVFDVGFDFTGYKRCLFCLLLLELLWRCSDAVQRQTCRSDAVWHLYIVLKSNKRLCDTLRSELAL